MMMTWLRKTFGITCSLWEESTYQQWILRTKGWVNVELWCFFVVSLSKILSKQWSCQWWYAVMLIWHDCDVMKKVCDCLQLPLSGSSDMGWHDMEIYYASLAFCERNPLVTHGFPLQRVSDAEIRCSLLFAWASYWTNSWVGNVLRCNGAHMTSIYNVVLWWVRKCHTQYIPTCVCNPLVEWNDFLISNVWCVFWLWNAVQYCYDFMLVFSKILIINML